MKRPGEGDAKCGQGPNGTCGNWQVDGLGACVLHVPDDLLDEAEEITGVRRCRHRFLEQDACRRYAAAGTQPPACESHGANSGSETRREGSRRIIEGKAADRLAEILAEHGDRLLRPDPVGDPLTELLELAAEMRACKEILRNVVAYLYSTNRVRYAHNKVGEQLRMEVLLYERALERYAKVLIDISKLKIEDRLAGVQERTARMMEEALDLALEESGVGLEGKQGAKRAFRRHLQIVRGSAA